MVPPKSVHHVIADPPFSAHVHGLQRRVLTGPHRQDPKKGGHGIPARDGFYRGNPTTKALGFAHLTAELRRTVAVQSARMAARWLIFKSDEESRHLWQNEIERAGGRHVRCGVWHKLNGQPQLSGDRPAVAHEAFEIAHARGERLRWNGGGMHAWWDTPCLWEVAIATDRNRTGERVHTTQTPLGLWLEIVEQFTDPGETVLDPFMGSGSLGIACVRLGRRYIGMDNGHNEAGRSWASIAKEGLNAEGRGISRSAHVRGQGSLFGPAAHP